MIKIRNTPASAYVLYALVSTMAFNDKASAFDIRDCRLDAVTFIDPWSNASFKPDRIGLDIYYACGDDEEVVKSPVNLSQCRGPYGDIFLDGSFNENGLISHLLAVYSYHKGTSPCCGWSVFGPSEKSTLEERATWLPLGSAPRLGEWPFASIHNSWGTRDDLNGVVALICDPDAN